MEVNSTATVIEGIPMTVCVLRDVSDENRRRSLERIFYHDVLNMAGGIQGLAELLKKQGGAEPAQENQYRQWMVDLSRRLTEEILHQRNFVAAERGEFEPDLGLVAMDDLLREVQALYASHSVADGRNLLLGELCGSHILSDLSILRRILGNLVKNALEATPRGGTVTLSGYETEETVTFAVHNPGIIPPDVQLQIFRRSFSTKAESGRGLGSYSVKLFGERYLKGKVAFTSNEANGTTFTITLPRATTLS
jgi:signal transduction histidine kinase